MLFNPDFKEMLLALSEAKIDFLLVGAYAVAAHGHPRATGDLDLWVRPDAKTAPRVYRVLAEFGAPLHDLTIADLAKPGMVFQIGVEPSRIDILTAIQVFRLIMHGRIDWKSAWMASIFVYLAERI
ncbi:hypothetical protein [Fuerstiella marisgermanici]|uniref:Nucleotidyltransferase domain-containing protein n=1 Tax=Fuerstiella marisgermanici TaxID=1891926 RepID=A0A1P8WKB6_9PLAN|nr:hypothetical protein [Fuerstiella marisgermanici]APZ94492.1 hypothetical protein Fuma_04124 [Fuerstiella marisgermanici]